MYGNQFHKYWEIKKIISVLELIEVWLLQSEKGKTCQFISEALVEAGNEIGEHLYRDVWKYWQKITSDAPETPESTKTKEERLSAFRMIKRIDALIEGRLISRSLANKSNAAMAIFILKNQGWSDQQRMDITSGDQKIESGPAQVSIINTNQRIKFDDQGNIISDTTSEVAEGRAKD